MFRVLPVLYHLPFLFFFTVNLWLNYILSKRNKYPPTFKRYCTKFRMLQFNNPRSQYSILQRFDFSPYYAHANNIRMVEFHLFTMHRTIRQLSALPLRTSNNLIIKQQTLGSLINKRAAASIAFTSSISRYIDHRVAATLEQKLSPGKHLPAESSSYFIKIDDATGPFRWCRAV